MSCAELDNPLLQDNESLGLWRRLVLLAATEPRLSAGGFPLERGQLAVSLSALAEASGTTRQRMRTLVAKWSAAGMLTVVGLPSGKAMKASSTKEINQASNQGHSLVTICNYDEIWAVPASSNQGANQGHQPRTEGAYRENARAPAHTPAETQTQDSRLVIKNTPPVAPPIGVAPPQGGAQPEDGPAGPKPAKRKLDTRIPADWTVNPKGAEFARAKGMSDDDIAREAEHFRSHWTAAPGRAGLKRDWDAAWRTWCIKWQEFGFKRAGLRPQAAVNGFAGGRPGSRSHGSGSLAAGAANVLARRRGLS